MIEEQVPALCANQWYLDDGALAGTVEELQSVIDILQIHGPARGLYLSASKTTVWCQSSEIRAALDQVDPLSRGVSLVLEDGIILLGSPIGSTDFQRQANISRIDKVREITEKLHLMKDPQVEFCLLRSCLSIPKIMFTLRTTNPLHHLDIWDSYDRITREALGRILGAPLTDIQWSQAVLPVSLGGVGLRSSTDHAAAAYISSFLSALDLKEQILGALVSAADESSENNSTILSPELVENLERKVGSELSVTILRSESQKELSLKIDLQNHKLLKEKIDEIGRVRDIARINSLSLPNAGAWLNVIPSPALGLHLRPTEFIVSVKYRLGLDIFLTGGKCTACPRQSDSLGDHAISCGYEGERIARHDHIRNALYNTCSQACLGPTREVRDLISGSEARPADLFLPNWTGGQDTALDVTVVNPLQISMIQQAARTPGYALSKSFDRKVAKHGELCQRAGVVFVPLPLETLGGWHETTVKEVKKIASALSRQTGANEGETICHVIQRMSILLIKGNAALLLNRRPVFPTSSTDGIE